MTAGCTLCRRVFNGPAAGQVLDPRGQDVVQRYLTELANHVREAHPEIAAQVELSALQYRGYLLMGYYRITDDEEFNAMRDETRRLLHSTTRKVAITNEELRATADSLSEFPTTRDDIYLAMVQVRDRLCETEPQQPAILTV